jgi:hypothetical protein
MEKLRKTILYISLFGVTMAYFESSIVVYLREIYYPEGFFFPLKLLSRDIALTELFREAMSILMILSVAWLASKKFYARAGWFLYIFAVWDIFYYVFLKTLIGWPDSFLTWDILFLIPTQWVGPVIAPILVSLVMASLGLSTIFFEKKHGKTWYSTIEWALFIAGAAFLYLSFTWEYSTYILRHFSMGEVIEKLGKPELTRVALEYVPTRFSWGLYSTGMASLLAGLMVFIRRNSKGS